MKRILLITLLIVGLTAAYSFAQMGQGRMGQGMMSGQQQPAETSDTASYYPYSQMMGPGMMGYGGCGMMGPGMGHMGGMMGHMGGMMGQMRGMMGYGMGPGMKGGYSSEAYQKFLDDTIDLRKDLHSKKFEYFETLRNPEAKSETILKLEKEILDLQWKIYEKAPR